MACIRATKLKKPSSQAPSCLENWTLTLRGGEQRTINWRQRRTAAFLLLEHVGRPGLSLHISDAVITSVNSVKLGPKPGWAWPGGALFHCQAAGEHFPKCPDLLTHCGVLGTQRKHKLKGTMDEILTSPPAPTRPYKPQALKRARRCLLQ